jgi:hypothetical protein
LASRAALARIPEGKVRRLVGRFPVEIAPLATELSSLIERGAEVVGRARAPCAVDVLGNCTAVTPVVEDLARVLSRIHGASGVVIDVDVPRDLAFPGGRLDETMPGSGLGLAIVRDIAKLYGGSVTLDESPMGGMEARLALPAIA